MSCAHLPLHCLYHACSLYYTMLNEESLRLVRESKMKHMFNFSDYTEKACRLDTNSHSLLLFRNKYLWSLLTGENTQSSKMYAQHNNSEVYHTWKMCFIFFCVHLQSRCQKWILALVMSACLSVCLPAWNSRTPTAQIFMKFHIGNFYYNLLKHSNFY
jgi:hypothetical protein